MKLRIQWAGVLGLWLITSQVVLAQAIITAQGWGDTPQTAQKQALQELTQQVYTAVQSDIRIQQTLEQNQLQRSVDSLIQLQTEGFFQAVNYSAPYEDLGQITVHASLDATGVKKTIQQIKQNLAVDLSSLSRNQLEHALLQAQFLNNFLNILPPGLVDLQAEKDHAQQLRQQLYRQLNYAQLRLYIQPQNAKLKLGNQQVDHQNNLLIPAGEVPFEILAEGYHKREGRWFLSAGENQQRTLSLIPILSGKIEIEARGYKANQVLEQAAFHLAGYGLNQDVNADILLRLKLEPTLLTEINGIRFYHLRLVAEVKQGSKTLLVRSATSRNISENLLETRTQGMVKALIEAILVHEEMEKLFK
ncbi:hypothetical protein JX580_04665 [Thiomicrospira microaerophila]|uniref:hypothetical protein n=1 Tax=Thiomicrospira microaerophila TaxID=406020 RepID=UPI00200D11F1|nr:hypothetical protein [Thiomicrospira microaerophila]UQB43174.1 hypothetical protein JX580_04665 [Thiomicrospira microaerophila]